MKYILKFIEVLYVILGDITVRIIEFIYYILRIIWHLEIVNYSVFDYRIFKYDDNDIKWLNIAIGYYPNIYDYIRNRNYTEIKPQGKHERN